MKGGHKRWEQHRPQDHHEYHGWKEHHITYFSSAHRSRHSRFQRPTQRCVVVARYGATVQGATTWLGLFCSMRAGPTIGALALRTLTTTA
jgi:hypothetical protein